MSYNFTEEELYNRALFTIDNKGQDVYIAFEPKSGDSYLMIIFTDKGHGINDYHNEEFWDTLFDVLKSFDKERYLDYTIAAD